MALIIREARSPALVVSPARAARARVQPMGAFSLKGALSSVGSALKTSATQAARGAVSGAGESLATTLRNALNPLIPTVTTGGSRPGGMPTNYWPWIAGGAGALVVGYLVMRRRPSSS